MAKKQSPESEEAKLKTKVSAKRVGHSVKGDATFRALHKRLKREQRKRRSLTLRRKNAAGGKGTTAAPSA